MSGNRQYTNYAKVELMTSNNLQLFLYGFTQNRNTLECMPDSYHTRYDSSFIMPQSNGSIRSAYAE